MDSLGGRVLTSTTCPNPAMGDQVTNEAAGGLESLPRICGRRINQVLAQEVALGPLILLCCQSQPSESSGQGRIDRFVDCARLWWQGLLRTHRDASGTKAYRAIVTHCPHGIGDETKVTQSSADRSSRHQECQARHQPRGREDLRLKCAAPATARRSRRRSVTRPRRRARPERCSGSRASRDRFSRAPHGRALRAPPAGASRP